MRRIGNRVVSWLAAVAVTAMLTPVSMVFAAQNGPDTINSAAIIAADGTSGQTLTTGNGVKTGHIQNGAVTASKLGIVCANGEYLQYVFGSGWVCSVGTAGPAGPQGPAGPAGTAEIADGTVTTQKVADGAITDVKISGPISPSKIGAYAGVKTVHKGVTDNVNTFPSVVAALKALEGTTGRNVVFVMPGTYEEDFSAYILEGETRNVEIIGAGRSTTIIKAIGATDGGGRGYPSLRVPSGMTIRNLTFQGMLILQGNNVHDVRLEDLFIQQGTGLYIYGIFSNVAVEHITIDSTEIGALILVISGAPSLSLKDITINATSTSQAVNIFNGDGYPIRFVNSTISGGSAFQFTGAAEIVNSKITGLLSVQQGGSALYNSSAVGSGSLTVISSQVSGESLNGSATIRIDNSVVSDVPVGGNTKLSNSKILNAIGTYGNTVKMVNCSDGNYDLIMNGTY